MTPLAFVALGAQVAIAAAATAVIPPLLPSIRVHRGRGPAHGHAPTSFAFRVGDGGGLSLLIDGSMVNVSSTFSEPGPVLRSLNWSLAPASPNTSKDWTVAVDRSRKAFSMARKAGADTYQVYICMARIELFLNQQTAIAAKVRASASR